MGRPFLGDSLDGVELISFLIHMEKLVTTLYRERWGVDPGAGGCL